MQFFDFKIICFSTQAIAQPRQAARPKNLGSHEALLLVQKNLKPIRSRLGLVSISSDNYGKIIVPLVDSSTAERRKYQRRLNRILARRTPGVSVRVIPGKVSRQDLVRLNNLVKRQMKKENFAEWGTSIDVDMQAVVVSVPSDDYVSQTATRSNQRTGRASQAMMRLQQRLIGLAASARLNSSRKAAADLVVIEEGKMTMAQDARRNLSLYPANWLEVSGGGGCTAGFLMKRYDGQLRGTTAGHCAGALGRIGDDIFTNGTFVGTTVGNRHVNPTNSDLLSYTVPGHFGWNFVQAYANGSGWYVSGEIVQSQSNVEVCHAGRGLWANEGREVSCGRIKRINHSYTTAVTHNNMDCTEDRAYPGDSGGAMWNWGDSDGIWAAGNLTGSFTTGAWFWKKHYTCFHVMSDIRAAYGYTLVTH